MVDHAPAAKANHRSNECVVLAGGLLHNPTKPCSGMAGEKALFIYNPAEAKDRQRSREKAAQAPAQWICGETATVEVEIWNPTSQALKVSIQRSPKGLVCHHHCLLNLDCTAFRGTVASAAPLGGHMPCAFFPHMPVMVACEELYVAAPLLSPDLCAKVERVTLDAEHVGDPSVAPRDQGGSPPAWRPSAFAMSIPPNSLPSKVCLGHATCHPVSSAASGQVPNGL